MARPHARARNAQTLTHEGDTPATGGDAGEGKNEKGTGHVLTLCLSSLYELFFNKNVHSNKI